MLPTIDPPLFQAVTTGLVWLVAIALGGMAAVVALVAASAKPPPRRRATVRVLQRRVPDAA